MSIDSLITTSKSLYDHRVSEQRKEIESLKKQIQSEIYVVVTEDYFGGADNSNGNLIKSFWTKEDANDYLLELNSDYGLDVKIVRMPIN